MVFLCVQAVLYRVILRFVCLCVMFFCGVQCGDGAVGFCWCLCVSMCVCDSLWVKSWKCVLTEFYSAEMVLYFLTRAWWCECAVSFSCFCFAVFVLLYVCYGSRFVVFVVLVVQRKLICRCFVLFVILRSWFVVSVLLVILCALICSCCCVKLYSSERDTQYNPLPFRIFNLINSSPHFPSTVCVNTPACCMRLFWDKNQFSHNSPAVPEDVFGQKPNQ